MLQATSGPIGRSLSTKTKPRRCGVLPSTPDGGDRGIGAIRALMAVSRASFGNGSNEVFIFCSAPEWTKATGLMPRRLASWAWLLRWPLWFLQHADRVVSPTREAVAQKIIELAKAGERDPGRLCDATLEALGTSFRSAPVISDFARVPAYSSSELISGRPSDARALASISACSHFLRVRPFL